jgi:hypothetical protein
VRLVILGPVRNDLLRGLDFPANLCHTIIMNKTQTYFVAQRQPHNDEVEILWECTSEQQAEDACDRLNSNLALAGIPSTYYAYVL